MSNTKAGYLSVNKSRGYRYVQLRKSIRLENGQIKKKLIYSFGNYEKALEKMYSWEEDPNLFPDDLKHLGFNFDDLRDWILTLETRKTKTGKDFKIK